MSRQTGANLLYLDSSAIVKLVAAEPESTALLDRVRTGGPAIASVLARVEVERAVRRIADSKALEKQLSHVFERIALIKVDDSILQQAANLEPTDLRTFEALHLATALSVRDQLAAFVVYDRRLAAAAAQVGLTVATPD